MTSVWNLSCSLGNTLSVITAVISCGTPGIDTSTLPSLSNQLTEALPTGLLITVQFFGTIAWPLFSLFIGILPANTRFTFSKTSSLNISSVLKYLHSVCLVISSLVGPSPPVTKTIFTLFIALSIASRISSSLSRTDTMRRTSIPILFNSRPIQAEFVSTTCPISSSSPMVISSANIFLLLYLLYIPIILISLLH